MIFSPAAVCGGRPLAMGFGLGALVLERVVTGLRGSDTCARYRSGTWTRWNIPCRTGRVETRDSVHLKQ